MTSIFAKPHSCPSCHSAGVRIFYELDGVPTNSVLLLKSRQEALDFPRVIWQFDIAKSVVESINAPLPKLKHLW